MIAESEDQAPMLPFTSLYRHGFVRVAVALPTVRVAEPAFNLEQTLELVVRAESEGAVLVCFPELGISSYTAEDLFHQAALQDEVTAAIERLLAASKEFAPTIVVGAPVRASGRLFNCALVVHRGALLGVVPKSYLPAYREFYEKRQFAAARDATFDEVTLAGQTAPFGTELLFEAANVEGLVVHVELCEDLWVPVPPSSFAALGGATVLVNLSASNALVAKADYRRQLCSSQSARCVAAYLYAGAGPGESSTDLAFDGHGLIYENGDRLAESRRFSPDEQLIVADLDLERLAADRMRQTSFTDNATDHHDRLAALRRVRFEVAVPQGAVELRREIARFPYVPAETDQRDERCAEVVAIQVQGLATRLSASGIDKVVIGVSGGLDSTEALLVSAMTMDRLGIPRDHVLACTMPGFATGMRTASNADRLMSALGVQCLEIDIRPSAAQMLRDLGHPAGRGEPVYDITYENVQAGERTSHLFRLANLHGALVVGTSDLSEFALGYTTYGVGDQMAHYDLNASVPKTLVEYLIRWVIKTGEFSVEVNGALHSVLETTSSPELIPSETPEPDQPAQAAEAVVGPYELQDFHLYYLLRFGYRPSRIAYLAHRAWGDSERGTWPDLVPPDRRRGYSLAEIQHWLAVFLTRFIESQFKRSALPNAPKVGSGGSLSPRGDWRAPSDATARAWLAELERNVPSARSNGEETGRPC